MRISDWSSDVCSSDLPPARSGVKQQEGQAEPCYKDPLPYRQCDAASHKGEYSGVGNEAGKPDQCGGPGPQAASRQMGGKRGQQQGADIAGTPDQRSEEHTSELQSLMRNSHDVFRVQKKIAK